MVTARRMTPERRREHLIAAASEVYGRVPPEQVTVDDVTRAAGVSRALLYRYFPGLDELHAAALGTVVGEMISRIADGSITRAVGEFLDVAETHPAAYVALLRSGSVISTDRTDAIVDGVRDHIVALLQERGDITDPSPLVLMTLRGWVALVEGATLAWLPDRRVPRDELVAWLCDQLAAMLAVTAGRDDATSAVR
jgi:AcrR family transcriptional regulator